MCGLGYGIMDGWVFSLTKAIFNWDWHFCYLFIWVLFCFAFCFKIP